jgi:hypothetical protein
MHQLSNAWKQLPGKMIELSFQSLSAVDPEFLCPFFSVGYPILKCIKADDELDNLTYPRLVVVYC